VNKCDAQIGELRGVIRKLSPTGDRGFEGLMALVLTDVTGMAFSLAKSGSQQGRDGQSTLNSGTVIFEAKLYDGAVPKKEIVSKIAEIAVDDEGDADLWIVGSTGTIRSQDIATIEGVGKRVGIGTLILDWSEAGLPPLAALLGMTPLKAASFLASNTGTPNSDILTALDTVRLHSQFIDRVTELKAALEQPSVAPFYALKGNEEFLRKAFSSSARARAVFGQPLAPDDKTVSGVLERVALRSDLAKFVFSKPNGKTAMVLGSDGNGKSWLFAQAWLRQALRPLTIVLTPDSINEAVSWNSLEELIISNLIIQTGDSETDISRSRWRRHFDRWKRHNNPERPRLIVFVDGLNQRELQWKNIINTLGQFMVNMGCKLVLSCRTSFYRTTLKGRLMDPIEMVDVPEWTDSELQQLLLDYGTSITTLRPMILEFLRNPRIFAVAAALFKNREIEGFAELSVSRLLFEHIRMGASPASELLPLDVFVKGVRDHADKIIERLSHTNTIDLKIFDRPSGETRGSLSDRLAIISAGRFFDEVPGDATLYRLKDDSTPLALGLSLLNIALRAHRNDKDIIDELSNILDPISALDNTAEVLISALIAAVLSDDTPYGVIGALALAHVSLQNLDTSRFQEFRALSRRAPPAFLEALESAALNEGVTANLSWLAQALLESRKDPKCWPAIAARCKRWLSMYSSAPEHALRIAQSETSEERAKKFEKHKTSIDATMARFSAAEKALLGELVFEARGDCTKLNEIALRFLAGGPLQEFGVAFRNRLT
jgi:hypothetical protein